MPIKPAVEEELKKISDDTKRAQARALYEEFPYLQEAFLNERDYHRQVQETVKTRKDLETKTQEVEQLKKKNMDWWSSAEKEYGDMQTKNADLERKIQEIQTAKDGVEGSPTGDAIAAKYDSVIARLQKDLDESKLRMSTAVDSKKLDEEFQRRADPFASFMLDIVEAKEKHLAEFGTALGRTEILDFMKENNLRTVGEAYTQMTAAKRQTAWEEKKTKELQLQIETDLKAKYASIQMPTAEGMGPSPQGPLKLFINKESAGKDIPADGSGRLASLAAQEMRSEGKT